MARSRTKFGMTPTESVRCLVNRLSVKKCAFTMAEILLSLTIIGVVAAITLPSLTGNINERTWNTQRKALYARFSQAIALMPALNGYGTLIEDESGSVTEDTAAETFVTNGLAKVLKINNICDNDHLEDCGIVSKITTLGGVTLVFPSTMTELNSEMTISASGTVNNTSMIDTKAAAFETQNGESIAVFYNPNCIGDLSENPWEGTEGVYIQNRVCANFIYDLNGNKGPNTVGKDIGFMTAMYPSDVTIAAPYPAISQLSGTYAISPDSGGVSALKACTNYDSEYRIPNAEEAISMFVNKELMKSSTTQFSGTYWTSTKVHSNGQTRNLTMKSGESWKGQLDDVASDTDKNVWCIKR